LTCWSHLVAELGFTLIEVPESFKLIVVGRGAVLEDAYLVLGGARVGHSVDVGALVGVIAPVVDVERLVDVPTLDLLIEILAHRRIYPIEAIVVLQPVVVFPPVVICVEVLQEISEAIGLTLLVAVIIVAASEETILKYSY
jgi:hypothetical protein